MMTTKEPKLDKPGAGLPFPSNLFVRYVLGPLKSRKNTYEENAERFELEAARLLRLTKDMSEEELTQKILVPRLPGLEDSSRYWSAAMTLEHVMIVAEGMGYIIEKLGRGEDPGVRVDTAKVKPLGELSGRATLARFEKFLGHSSRVLARVVDRDSPVTHEHPWFGSLTAGQWFWVMGVHNTLHRRQIEAIRKGLHLDWISENDLP